MARSPSLTRRVTIALVVVQFVAFIGALFVTVFIDRPENFLASMGAYLSNIILADRIVSEPNGTFGIASDERLMRFIEEQPGFWYVVTDGRTVLSGSGATPAISNAPESMAQLATALETLHKLTGMKASAELQKTPAGELLVVTGGAVPDTLDIVTLLYYVVVKTALWLVLPISAGSLLVVGLIARRALRSLRHAAEAAAKIDPENHGERLPVKGTPKELMPLVQAVNSALERLDAGYERQRRFIADAAHELRTPVAVLRTRLDALPDGPLKDELLGDARRVSDLATWLLELERLRRAAPPEDPVDLVALAREVAAELGPLALDRGYDLAVEADALAVLVLGDGGALRRVLANLVSNAIAHGGGRGLINLHVARSGTVAVSDQGPGVPAAEADMIFEPFHRAAASGSGAGLGLALARETMTAHGGRIRLVPGTRRGATFRLEFPPERLYRQAA